jgi:hypothetical protein
MSKLIALALISAALLLAPPSNAQSDSSAFYLATIDTAALYDSLLQELRMLGLAGRRPQSYFDINVGLGNGNFAWRNAALSQHTGQLFYTGGLGYYHKSGISLSGGVNLTNNNGNASIYQSYISPAYDFRNRKLATGISFYRYFNQRDLSFYVSPLVNELYGYFALRKNWLQPKLAIDYAWGTYDELAGLQLIDTVRFRRFAPIVRYLSRQNRIAKVSDLSLMFSLRHDFVTTAKDGSDRFFRYSPSVLLLAGTATYGTNTPLNSLTGPRMANLTNVQLFTGMYGQAFTPPNQQFSLQNLNITNSAMLGIGKWYLLGQFVLTYLIPREQSGWQVFFNMTTGLTL